MSCAARLAQIALATSVFGLATARAQDAGPPEVRHERREHLRERMVHLRDESQQRRHVADLRRDIDLELSKDAPDREALQKKFEELAATRDERRRLRQLALGRRYGSVAERPEIRREFERHGRTVAKIERLKFLAATERGGPTRAQLLERIAKLSEREERRHQRSTKALLDPGGSPAPSASAAAPSSSSAKP